MCPGLCAVSRDLGELPDYRGVHTAGAPGSWCIYLFISLVSVSLCVSRFVCHVISVSYQTIEESTLQELLGLVDENAIKVSRAILLLLLCED